MDHNAWNGPSWSISTEFYTYLVFALIYSLSGNRYRLCVAGLAAASLIALLYWGHTAVGFDYTIIRCIFGFAAGVIVCDIYLSVHSRSILALTNRRLMTFLEILLCATIFIYVYLADSPVLVIFATVIFAVTVFVFSFEGGMLSEFLCHKIFLEIGRLSYSIYMIHMFLFVGIIDVSIIVSKTTGLRLVVYDDTGHPQIHTNLWQGDLAVATSIILVIGCSYISYALIENPCRRWFRNFVSRSN